MLPEYLTAALPTGKHIPPNSMKPRFAFLLLTALWFCFSASIAFARTITWAGLTWEVKNGLLGPGPNYFSDATDMVWVDASNRLHLAIKQDPGSGQWLTSQVNLTQSLGHGLYLFALGSTVDVLDPQMTLGLFTYDPNAPTSNYREIDI